MENSIKATGLWNREAKLAGEQTDLMMGQGKKLMRQLDGNKWETAFWSFPCILSTQVSTNDLVQQQQRCCLVQVEQIWLHETWRTHYGSSNPDGIRLTVCPAWKNTCSSGLQEELMVQLLSSLPFDCSIFSFLSVVSTHKSDARLVLIMPCMCCHQWCSLLPVNNKEPMQWQLVMAVLEKFS